MLQKNGAPDMMNFAAFAGKRWRAIITTVEKLSDLLVTRHQSLCPSLGSSGVRWPQRFRSDLTRVRSGMKTCFVVARLGKSRPPSARIGTRCARGRGLLHTSTYARDGRPNSEKFSMISTRARSGIEKDSFPNPPASKTWPPSARLRRDAGCRQGHTRVIRAR